MKCIRSGRIATRKIRFREINSSQSRVSFDIATQTAQEIRLMLEYLKRDSRVEHWDGVEIWNGLRFVVEAAGGDANAICGKVDGQ